MADLSLQDYGTIQVPNMLDVMTKQATLDKYNLDVAKESRDYNALKKYGEGAMRDDPEAQTMLGSQNPAALQIINSLKGTAVQTQQSKENLQKGIMQRVGSQVSQISDPAEQLAALHRGIDEAVSTKAISQAEADNLRHIINYNPQQAINGLIHANLAAAQTPLVTGQSAAATAQAQAELNRQQGARQPPHDWWGPEVGSDGKPVLNPDGTVRWKQYQVNPAVQPGAPPPGSGFGGTPYAPTIVPGVPAGPAGGTGIPPRSPPATAAPAGAEPPEPAAPAAPAAPATRGIGPRSEAPGKPAARLANYTQMDDEAYGAGHEFGFGGVSPPTSLPQTAFRNRLYGPESGFKDVKNRMGSSASGLGQFIDSTWKSQMQKLIPDQIAGMSDQQIQALRSDSRLQDAATISYAEDNAKVLAQAGFSATAANLAMAHKLGPGGAIKALRADPNASMVSVLGGPDTKATQQNPTWARQSVAGFINSNRNAFGDLPIRGVGAPATETAPTVATGATVPAPSAAAIPPAERSGPIAAAGPATAAATRSVTPGAPATEPGAPTATPAAAAEVPAATAVAWTPGRPNTGSFTYGGGDSIGLGFIKGGGVPGTTSASTTVKGSEHADGVGSRNPQQALDFITAHPDRFEGQDVLWSTGLYNSGGVKNAEKNMEIVGKQIDEMQKAKANNIVLAGVQESGPYSHLNDQLEALAKEKGIQFGGALPTSDIHLPNNRAYKDYVQNASRALEQKQSEAEPGPRDTVENPPTTGIAPASEVQLVADTSGGLLPPPDRLVTEAPKATPPGTSSQPISGLPPGWAARPSEAELKKQEQEALEPGKLRQQRIEAEQTAEAASGQKVFDESRTQSHEAHNSIQQLDQISNMLHEKTITGPTAPTRQALYRAWDEFARLAGRPETDAGREAARLALISTAGSELAFAMVKALGSREAVQVVQQVMNIKPNISLSVDENKMIIESLRQGMQRSIDRHDFIVQNREKLGIHGAEHEFNKQNPTEVYSSKVVPFPMPDNKEGLKHGVIYDTNSTQPGAQKGKWNEKKDEFERAKQMADPTEEIYLPEVLVTPDDKPPSEGPVYSAGGGLATAVREQLEKDSPELQVAEATPPNTFKFVPKEERVKPPSEEPGKEEKEKPKEPEPPATFKFLPPDKRVQPKEKEAEPQGIGWNVAAGLGESVAPGVASAIGSPVDIPLAVGRAAYGSLMGLYEEGKDIFNWARTGENPLTIDKLMEREKKVNENNPIPKAPLSTYLTKKFGDWGFPTPESPFTSVVPQNEEERIARRAAQVGGQVAATTLGSKTFGMVRPPPPTLPMVTAADRAKGAANLALAAPTTLASAPPIASGLVAGGASVGGQYAAERAKEAGVSPENAALIEKYATMGLGLPLGLGGAAVHRAGAATGVNQLARRFSTIPLQEMGASGTFGPWTQQRSREALAGRALANSPINTLAQEGGGWNQSNRDIGRTLKGQETYMESPNSAEQAAQRVATARLDAMGGDVADLTGRVDKQQKSLSGDLSYWNIAPEAAGKTIRSGLTGGIIKKEGPLAGLLGKDEKGKPLVPDSALPDKIFNEKMTPENFTSMFHQAKAPFREAYQSTVLAKFFDKVGIKDASGKPIGIDLDKAETWLNTNKSALEASERKMRDVWGEDQRLKYSVKDRIDAAIAKQQGINDLNLNLDAMLKGFSTGGKQAAIAGSVWQPGSAGAASLRDYLRMSNGDPDAVANVVDIAAANLRNNAMKSDKSGLDPTKTAGYLLSHRDSINQLPPAERAKFSDAATAQATVDAHTAARAQALDAFKNGAAKGMLGGMPVDEAIRRIFADKTQSPEVAFRELSNRLRSDPAAHDALSSAFIQHGVEDALSRTQAEMSAGVPTDRLTKIINAVKGNQPTHVNENSIRFMDNFNSFLRNNEKTVSELFGVPATTEMMKITGHTGYKKPSHPIMTALTTALLAGETFGYGIISHSMGKQQPVLTGSIAFGLAVKTGLQRLKAAGITNVNDFIPKVMSNPQMVRDLARGVEDKAAWTRVMQQLAVIGTDEEMGRYGMGNPSPDEVKSKINIPRFRTEPGYRQSIQGQLRVPHTPIPHQPRISAPLAR